MPFFIGLGAWLLLGKRSAPAKCPALVFHEVSNKPSLFSLSEISQKRFTAFADELVRRDYRTLRLSDAVEAPAGRGATVALTFDDAFESVFTLAAPVLRHNNQTATIFAVAGFLGRRSTWDVYAARTHCSAAQLRQLAADGFEIGSHSLTHPDLRRLDDRELAREIGDSKKLLEDSIGAPVTAFSFPFGSWNARVWEMVLNAGYRCATVYRGAAAVADSRRVPVYGVYAFDSTPSIFNKIDTTVEFSLSRAQSRIMAHFAKGSAVVKFRKEYKR
ncbi:MAG: polysaccharide deacetylase family protein [Chitinivibrionales bacterium]|nr:polysaccharide deacetylase family protein [Chitinivibrionales bacterium]